jgi:crossover junction endodeoxyribonuclease RusA
MMGAEVRFAVHGVPAPKGSMRAFVRAGRAVLTNDRPETRTWEQRVAAVAEDHAMESTLCGPVEVRLRFYLPLPASAPKRRRIWPVGRRNDVDKLTRAVLDALTGPILGDDGQVVRLVAEKDYGDPPRVEIAVREIG